MMILWHVNAWHFVKTCSLTQKWSTLSCTHPIIQFLITHKIIFISFLTFQSHIALFFSYILKKISFYIHLNILDLKMHITITSIFIVLVFFGLVVGIEFYFVYTLN